MPMLKKINPGDCPHCDWKSGKWLWRFPDDLEPLARELGIPVNGLRSLIHRDKIPVRVGTLEPVDGAEFVYIKDAIRGPKDWILTWH